jgi:hypothetical protein
VAAEPVPEVKNESPETVPAAAAVSAPAPEVSVVSAGAAAPAAAVAAAATAPVMTATPAAATGTVGGLGAGLLSWLTGGAGDGAPAAAPLAWTAAAFTRRDLNGSTAPKAAAATIDSGQLFAGFGAASATGSFKLFGNGTAADPNGGILIGNGFTYTKYEGSCTTGACAGGTGGLLGNGGGGFAAGMFGWSIIELGIYGIILNITAIGGSIWGGRLDTRRGSKWVVMASIIVLIVATVGIVSTGPGFSLFGLMTFATDDTGGFFATGAEKAYVAFGLLIGLVFGPVQASSRAYMARSVSEDESGRYFGLYALAGRATSFVAPLSVAVVTQSLCWIQASTTNSPVSICF